MRESLVLLGQGVDLGFSDVLGDGGDVLLLLEGQLLLRFEVDRLSSRKEVVRGGLHGSCVDFELHLGLLMDQLVYRRTVWTVLVGFAAGFVSEI